MDEKSKELMAQLTRLGRKLHRYQVGNRNFALFGSPHRGQGRILSILKMQPEISQKELGYLLDMRNQSLGEMLSKLEKSGYITRTQSEEDKRTAIIRLTKEGEDAAHRVSDSRDEPDIFASFGADEREKLSGYVDRIIAEIDKITEFDARDAECEREAWRRRFMERDETDETDTRNFSFREMKDFLKRQFKKLDDKVNKAKPEPTEEEITLDLDPEGNLKPTPKDEN